MQAGLIPGLPKTNSNQCQPRGREQTELNIGQVGPRDIYLQFSFFNEEHKVC